MYKHLIFLVFCFFYVIDSNAIIRKIPVAPSIHKSIKTLVELNYELHEASYRSEKKEIAKILPKIIAHIDKSKKIIINDNIGAQHIIELLDAIKLKSEEAKPLQKQAQRDVLKVLFRKLTRITQRYYVGNYRTFYCRKNQDLWIQRHWLAYNPIHPKSRCGKLAN